MYYVYRWDFKDKKRIRRNSRILLGLQHGYNAGACLPFKGPFGCRGQLAAVIAEMLLYVCPQYLQVYLLFSLPS